MRFTALFLLIFLPAAALAGDSPAVTDSGDVRIEDALRLIEDESPAAQRQMFALIQNLEATMRRRGNDADYLVVLAKAYSRMNPQFGAHKGNQLADEALKLKPKHVEALLYKADMATHAGCLPCVTDLIEQAKKAGAPQARLHVAQAGMYMVEAMSAQRNPGGAAYETHTKDPLERVVAETEKAIALETDRARKARLLTWLFEAHRHQGDREKARAAGDRALEANPDNRAFAERYAMFLLQEGELDRASEIAGKLAYHHGFRKADETIAVVLYLKWARAWEKDPKGKRTQRLYEVAHKNFSDLNAVVHTASGSEATAPVASALILSGKFDVRAGDYRDQDGDTTLGNIVLRLADEAMAKKYGGAGPRPTEQYARLMEILIRKGANPNAWVSRGREPMLAAAARAGSTDTVKALIKAGARPNDAGALGTTALIAAAQSDDKQAGHEIAKLLLARGAELHSLDQYKQSALMAAARSGNGALVRELVARGASVKSQDENQWGALEYAAQSGDLATVKSLLAANAEVRHIWNGCGRTNAAKIAEQSGHKEIAELLRSQMKEGV